MKKLFVVAVVAWLVAGWTTFTNADEAKGQVLYEIFEDGQRDIWMMNIDGTGKTLLAGTSADEYAPRFYPIGNKISYVVGGQFVLKDLDTGIIQEITQIPADVSQHLWLDESRLLYRIGSCWGSKLYMLEVDTGEIFLVLDPAIVGQVSVDGFSLSPDQDKLAFVAQAGCWAPTTDLYIADMLENMPDGLPIQEATMLYQDPTGDSVCDTHPLWLAGLNRIVWDRHNLGAEPGPDWGALMSISPTGTDVQTLAYTEGTYSYRPLAWAADVNEIVLSISPWEDIYTMSPDGTGLENITATPDKRECGWYGDYRAPVEATLPVTVNLHPNTLNLRSRGRPISATIWLPAGYLAADIDVDTIRLHFDGAPPEGFPVVKTRRGWRASMHRARGYRLSVQFDRQLVASYLEPGEVEMTVTGKLADGTRFQGSDTVRVIGRGRW